MSRFQAGLQGRPVIVRVPDGDLDEAAHSSGIELELADPQGTDQLDEFDATASQVFRSQATAYIRGRLRMACVQRVDDIRVHLRMVAGQEIADPAGEVRIGVRNVIDDDPHRAIVSVIEHTSMPLGVGARSRECLQPITGSLQLLDIGVNRASAVRGCRGQRALCRATHKRPRPANSSTIPISAAAVALDPVNAVPPAGLTWEPPVARTCVDGVGEWCVGGGLVGGGEVGGGVVCDGDGDGDDVQVPSKVTVMVPWLWVMLPLCSWKATCQSNESVVWVPGTVSEAVNGVVPLPNRVVTSPTVDPEETTENVYVMVPFVLQALDPEPIP
jgi:hypothetical protein